MRHRFCAPIGEHDFVPAKKRPYHEGKRDWNLNHFLLAVELEGKRLERVLVANQKVEAALHDFWAAFLRSVFS